MIPLIRPTSSAGGLKKKRAAGGVDLAAVKANKNEGGDRISIVIGGTMTEANNGEGKGIDKNNRKQAALGVPKTRIRKRPSSAASPSAAGGLGRQKILPDLGGRSKPR